MPCQRVFTLWREIYKLGVLSLPIIVVSAGFVGMVLALQGYTILRNFSAESVGYQAYLCYELGSVLMACYSRLFWVSGKLWTAEILP